MARTAAALPPGPRLTDYISVGVLTAGFPIEIVREVLACTGRTSQRERDLPAIVRLHDGSCRIELRWNRRCRSNDRRPIPVRLLD